MSEIDSISLGVYRDKLVSICDQMTNTLARTSFSPALREAYDLSVGITDTDGRLVAEATNSLPNFTQFLSQATKNIIAEHGRDGFEDGDVIISNDPWSETTHQYDIAIIRPVFHGGELVAFTSGMGHFSDIGGRPWTAYAESVFEEGLVIPPTKLVRAGEIDDSVEEIIRANVRVPNEVMGDIKSFLSSTYTGSTEFQQFLEDHDVDFQQICDQIIDISVENAETAIGELPDGHYEDSVTAYGVDSEITIDCAITIDGTEIEVDYTGTSGQVPYAFNVPKLYTDSYTLYASKCFTATQTRETDGDFEPVTVHAPKGCILNPEYPAAIAGRGMIGHHCATLTSRVLSQVAPDMVMADPGMIMTTQINYEVPGEDNYSEMMFNAGGAGATARKDGEPTLSVPTNLASISLESMEAKTGNLRFLEKSLWQDSGGPGRYQGGLGQRIRLENVADHEVNFNFLGRRARTPPKGIEGGGDGTVRQVSVGGEQVPVKSENTVASGEVIEYREGGGGGFGDPAERDLGQIVDDLQAGRISLSFAEEHYDVDADVIEMEMQ
jgi:N-methylhydantoinase B